eukprot:gnl/Chilomastix_cuspidata/1932.p1 GENE.gnl/Chilomastix_cuspidata/1932~~gnl/Chilomastix_cuspidata/1932.p1  ORF type:complete len:181 (+),score=66.12 gnl/Chilomastix_cuspidata/1932:25-543(+)
MDSLGKVVHGLIVLGSDGTQMHRYFYVDEPEDPKRFLEELVGKTRGIITSKTIHVLHHANRAVVFKKAGQTEFYLVSDIHENELLLAHILSKLLSAVYDHIPFEEELTLAALKAHYSAFLVLLDEMIDGGELVSDDPTWLFEFAEATRSPSSATALQSALNGVRFLGRTLLS